MRERDIPEEISRLLSLLMTVLAPIDRNRIKSSAQAMQAVGSQFRAELSGHSGGARVWTS
jgi:hypothetical protein